MIIKIRDCEHYLKVTSMLCESFGDKWAYSSNVLSSLNYHDGPIDASIILDADVEESDVVMMCLQLL
jgi:hypothetical protein